MTCSCSSNNYSSTYEYRSIEVLNIVWLLVLYGARESYISIQFFSLNLIDLVYCPTGLLFFDIPSYSIILISDHQYFLSFFYWRSISFFRYFLSCTYGTVSELFCYEFFETFDILLAILLPIKWPVASGVFWIVPFEAVLNASVADFLAKSKSFWLYLPIKFYLHLYQYFYPYF